MNRLGKTLKGTAVLCAALLLVFSIAACGKKDDGAGSGSASAPAGTTAYELTADDAVTTTGSLIPAWAEKGVSSTFILGAMISGSEVTGNMKDAASTCAFVISIIPINFLSNSRVFLTHCLYLAF